LRPIFCRVLALTLVLVRSVAAAAAPGVTAHVVFTAPAESGHGRAPQKQPETVLWLTPLDRQLAAPDPGSFVMAQHDKMFSPHILVMPVGSTVAFPNRDPFFHNVFSFFNGRRFDLGLYQSGQSRSVVFNRVGVSYIFCNIHPEMSAVIITLDTPYYAIADEHGDIHIAGVPPGSYNLQVWSQAISPEASQPPARRVTVNAVGDTDLGAISIHVTPGALTEHLNKFGEPYDKHTQPAY
jgi:plastocyanin